MPNEAKVEKLTNEAKVEKSPAPHLEAFLEAANYFLGIPSIYSSRGQEMAATAGFPGYTGAWCAVFVMACAARAGLLGTVIGRDPNAYAIEVQRITVDYCDGEWIEGPAVNGGAAVTPIPGDLITFGWTSYYTGYEHASHIGIVEYVKDGQVHTIEGNTHGESDTNVYDLDFGCINMYVRPNWAKVGDDITSYLRSAGLRAVKGPLYANKNDRHDMTVRQVGYLDNQYKLSNNSSGLAVSIINYTTVLGQLYDSFAGVTEEKIIVDTSKLNGNTKIAMDYFLGYGFSASSASALVGCLLAYSNLQTNHTEQRGKLWFYGIASWPQEEVSKKIKPKLGNDWTQQNNLSAQLDYFLNDLLTNFKDLVTLIKPIEIDESKVDYATDRIMYAYNKQFITGSDIKKAKQYALDVFNSLTITYNSVIGSTKEIRDDDGNLLDVKFSVTIPSDVDQTGIWDDFTSYSAYYSDNKIVWGRGTPQRELADIWAYRGCTADRGIATIGGYYCVAVTSTFGTIGDIIVVTLEDNIQFAAIIADQKGEDADSKWGHVYPSGVSIIEWERIVTFEGKVQAGGTSALIVDSADFGDWEGKKVINITNYGSYL